MLKYLFFTGLRAFHSRFYAHIPAPAAILRVLLKSDLPQQAWGNLDFDLKKLTFEH